MLPRLTLLACVLTLALVSPAALADEGATQAQVTASDSLVDTLKEAQAKKSHIMVLLKSGAHYSARTIKDVSKQAVVLQGPHQKEFYDVYIVLDAIAAVEVRARN